MHFSSAYLKRALHFRSAAVQNLTKSCDLANEIVEDFLKVDFLLEEEEDEDLLTVNTE